MKRAKSISAIILLAIMAGCGGGNKQSAADLITVDVNANYPEKELILQDFMDVEYVALETTDDFLTQGVVKAIGKNIILVTNRIQNGDIFIFNRTGKGLRKINRLGQGNEEYSSATEIILDEDNNEMFVVAYSARKIWVYDLYGNYKRSFPLAETSYYRYTFNYDRDNLICHKGYSPLVEDEKSCHILISKQDGSITKEIQLPFSKIETPVVVEGEGTVVPTFDLTIPYHNSWILMRPSSDTVYTYQPDGHISPLMVRTPSIHAMDPQVFIFPTVITDPYFFIKTLKKEFDFERMKGYPTTNLVYDKQENSIFKYTVYNDDFLNKKQVSWGSKAVNPVNQEIATFQVLNAPNLVETYENGQLQGKLKEIAAELDEESNPVIMLVKHKK